MTYLNNGTYSVKLIVRSDMGCVDTTSETVVINATPDVKFSAQNNQGCQPLSVLFSDSSKVNNGFVQGWFWDFGDNSTSVGGTSHDAYLSKYWLL